MPPGTCEFITEFLQNYGGPLEASFDDFRIFGFQDTPFSADGLIIPGDRRSQDVIGSLEGTLNLGSETFRSDGLPVNLETLHTLRNVDGNARIFDAEIADLFVDLRRISGLPFDAWIDLDPETAALGMTTVNEFESGEFHLASYFDIRTRLNVDFDRDGIADEIFVAAGTSRLLWYSTQVPEPTTISLTVVLLMGLTIRLQRRV